MLHVVRLFSTLTEEECPTEDIDYLDDRLGDTRSGEPISDSDRGWRARVGPLQSERFARATERSERIAEQLSSSAKSARSARPTGHPD